MAATVLVDTNVILDILTDDPVWAEWAIGQLERLATSARLAINPIIYSELAVGFTAPDELDTVLAQMAFEYEDVPRAALFLAAAAFRRYRAGGGVKRSPLPDFYIGAHAQAAGYVLLTRDATRYRTYFPQVELISPD